jgi:hypothetical protein
MTVDYSQGAPPPPPKKKGLGVVGWIAIGCGAIALLGLLALFAGGFMLKRVADKVTKNPARTAAEILVRTNPDLEIVNSDDDAQTVTIRDKKKNETVTVNLEELKEGRIKFGNDEGTSTIDFNAQGTEGGVNITATDEKGQTSTFSAGAGGKLPDWIPLYPGGSAQSSWETNNAGEHSAMVVVTSSDSPEKVIEFYEARLKAAGLEVQKNISQSGNETGGMVTGTSVDQKRTANILIGTSEGSTSATVTYTEKP